MPYYFDLSPFPLLGLPGWDEDNENEVYYDNSRYFRPERVGTGQPGRPRKGKEEER